MIAHPMNEQEHNMANGNQDPTEKKSDFSIDYILNRAGSSCVSSSENTKLCEEVGDVKFQWLHCSRYCPPRVPRIQKKDVQKRQLGRHPRIPFTSYQLSLLEQKFKESPYLSSEEVILMSQKLQLADIRVKIWFQNRRARERRERIGDFKTKDEKNVPLDADSDEKLTRINHEGNNSSEYTPNQESLVNNIRSAFNSSINFVNPFTPNVSNIFENNCVPSPYFLTSNLSGYLPHVNFSKNKDDNS